MEAWSTPAQEELSELILKLHENEPLRVCLGQRGRKAVEENYSWKRVLDCMESVYRRGRLRGNLSIKFKDERVKAALLATFMSLASIIIILKFTEANVSWKMLSAGPGAIFDPGACPAYVLLDLLCRQAQAPDISCRP